MRTGISKLNHKREIVINFKEAKIIKKLLRYQKLIVIEPLEILSCTNFHLNDTLSYIIPKF